MIGDSVDTPALPDIEPRTRPALLLNRRAIIAGGAALLGMGAAPVRVNATGDALADLERSRGGRLGVFALDLQTGRTLGHRADERFRLMSSFKGLLTAMILSEVARGADRLDASVSFGPADLMEASPVTQANVARGAMSVRDLCEAAMYRSDNAAANLLMRRAGGPTRLTAFLRGIGDRVTRVDHYEGHLTEQPLPADSTTPRAVVRTMRQVMFGPVLQPAARRQWEAWMEGNVVGRSRLRAGFPTDWMAGDRTGTADGICNDYAFAYRPGRAPLLLSAYYAAEQLDIAAQEGGLREVARLMVTWQAQQGTSTGDDRRVRTGSDRTVGNEAAS